MGSQIRFYMTEEDEAEFIRFLRSTGDIVISPAVSSSAELKTLDSFWRNTPEVDCFGCVLWNRDISPEPKINFVPEPHGLYYIDKLDSEVVDVTPCSQTRNKLSLGRFHIEKTFLDQNGHVAKKSKEFISWYEKICKWVHKNYKKIEKGDYLSKGEYMSDRASTLKNEGINLVEM